MAVDKYHEIFQKYQNVIICSIRGEVSFASKLAGGGKTPFGYFVVPVSDYFHRL